MLMGSKNNQFFLIVVGEYQAPICFKIKLLLILSYDDTAITAKKKKSFFWLLISLRK
jgi:hypothetical protein